jgi:hypothetical protein
MFSIDQALELIQQAYGKIYIMLFFQIIEEEKGSVWLQIIFFGVHGQAHYGPLNRLWVKD